MEKLTTNNKQWYFIVGLISLAVLSFMTMYCLADSDSYYLLANGDYILQNGIPHINPFISIPNQTIVIQNWLYDVILSLIYRIGKSAGLFAFVFGQGILVEYIMYKFINKKNIVTFLSLNLFLIFFGYINPRPEMITFILIMLEIFIVERVIKTNKTQLLYFLPLLTLAEINLHASYWIMHYVVLLPYVMPSFNKLKMVSHRINPKYLIVPSLLMSASLFVNPYGKDAITYVFKAISAQSIKSIPIQEQLSPALLSFAGFVFVLSIGVFIYLWTNGQLLSSDIYFYIGFGFLLIREIKWITFFVISLLCLMRALNFKFSPNIKMPKIMWIILLPIIVAFSQIGAQMPKLFTTDYYNTAPSLYIAVEDLNKITTYIDGENPDAQIFAGFTESNYFEFRGYTIFMDARPELYCENIAGSNQVFETFYNVYYHKDLATQKELPTEKYSMIVDSIDVDYFVVNKEDAVLNCYLANNSNYKQIMDLEYTVLYAPTT